MKKYNSLHLTRWALVAALAFVVTPLAHARDSVSIGLHLGVPYYAEAPAYYVPAERAMWWDSPVEIVYINGVPHRLHMWHGRWYDEAWVAPAPVVVAPPPVPSGPVPVGTHLGVPYYTDIPPYYSKADDPLWWDTPVEMIDVAGVPHRMHLWHGHWYDEAWARHEAAPAPVQMATPPPPPAPVVMTPAGMYQGVPYYVDPAPYYVESDYGLWWNTPVEIVYVHGVPHRMHMWHGHWYDEAWVHHHHDDGVKIDIGTGWGHHGW